ncbi:MAG: beta-galactosidase trimerization domain-containing protein [Armatimonadetes bacterium]|nr:beta-galactosidase trimerization domain-containing protein [Armatimonadota bacterium]
MPRSLCLLLACPLAACAVPVEQTRYGQAVLRVEGRPSPPKFAEPDKLWAVEHELARSGVGARWIQMVSNEGVPFLRNDFIPCPYPEADAYEATLREWVRQIHDAGLPAMSWYPLIFCPGGNKAHPDWRQVSLIPWVQVNEHSLPSCPNSGYGDALIGYCVDAIGRLGLDGIWFDGSVLSLIWQRPAPLTCVCEHCRARFKLDTGLDLPARADFDDPGFRRWVAWRTQMFGEYIGRLAGAIRAKHPHCAVVINHYHRPGISWHSAVPLDRYDADIISGSEAFSPDTLDLTQRLCRAYGRSQAEVWRQFDTDAAPEVNAERLLQHALISYSAGGFPAFGGDPFNPRMAPTAALMAPIMRAVHPFVGGPALAHTALHVSQQTETFHFGRANLLSQSIDPYFASLGAWTSALGEAHLPPDYVYDRDFTPARLRRYKVLLMPLAQALSDAQAACALGFARDGGVLVPGVAAGQLDADGIPRATNPLGRALGFAFDHTPLPDGSDAVDLALQPAGGGPAVQLNGPYAPLTLTAREWQPVYLADGRPAVATRRYRRGHVFVLATDAVRNFGSQPVSGGKTRLEVADETAAAGRWSLRYTDDALAPQPFYPDLESHVAPFSESGSTGGELSCDLRVGAAARVSIEIRSTEAPIAGPILGVADGRVYANGQPVCEVPLDQWFHLRVGYGFATAGKPAEFETVVTLPAGAVHRLTRPSPEAGYHRTDWLVIYGAGEAAATFYLDNLNLERLRVDGTRQTMLWYDFEAGPATFGNPTGLVTGLAERLKALAPPPMAVEAPGRVRAGVFERGGKLLVHLHDRDAVRSDWLQARGAAVTLRCGFAVKRARLPLVGRDLPVSGRMVKVPAMGLYQVVELER